MSMLEAVLIFICGVLGGSLVTGLIAGVTRQRQLNYAYMEGFADGSKAESAKYCTKSEGEDSLHG